MKMKITKNIVCELLLILVFLMHLILCSVSKDIYELTTTSLCPEYNITVIATAYETICAMVCTRNKIYGSKGFCYNRLSKICKIYGVPDLGTDSHRLKWISLKKFHVAKNYTEGIQECKKHEMGMVLPTTQDELDDLRDFAKMDLRVDLNDLDNTKNFTTYEEKKSPPMYFWANGQPDYRSVDRCVTYFIGPHAYHDYVCNEVRTVFCQKPRPLLCKEAELIEDDQYDIVNGPCYKIKN